MKRLFEYISQNSAKGSSFKETVKFLTKDWINWQDEVKDQNISIEKDQKSDNLFFIYLDNKHIGTYNSDDEELWTDDINFFGNYISEAGDPLSAPSSPSGEDEKEEEKEEGGDKNSDEQEEDKEEKEEENEGQPEGEDADSDKGNIPEVDPKLKERAEIKFKIWRTGGERADWLNDEDGYQKIEYVYNDKKKNITIDFLLGRKDGVWQLWAGKDGAVGYDDEPMYNLEVTSFRDAIMTSLDKVQELIADVKENPDNWVQFYLNK